MGDRATSHICAGRLLSTSTPAQLAMIFSAAVIACSSTLRRISTLTITAGSVGLRSGGIVEPILRASSSSLRAASWRRSVSASGGGGSRGDRQSPSCARGGPASGPMAEVTSAAVTQAHGSLGHGVVETSWASASWAVAPGDSPASSTRLLLNPAAAKRGDRPEGGNGEAGERDAPHDHSPEVESSRREPPSRQHCRTSSTRRLRARPSIVSFDSRGFPLP